MYNNNNYYYDTELGVLKFTSKSGITIMNRFVDNHN